MEKKSGRNFWIVFGLLLLFAAVATIGNLKDYGKMGKLETQGKRILVPVDSLIDKGSKREIFVSFTVGDKEFSVRKKVKANIAVGDSVPVYFNQEDPSTNTIAVE